MESEPDKGSFYSVSPETILRAVESLGVRCTGRVLQLNSLENRVYEVEIDLPLSHEVKSPSERFRVVKFYRPGRWSEEQIKEEHQYLLDLVAEEVPVIAPLVFPGGGTVGVVPENGIKFAVFPKQGGRNPDEFTPEQLEIVGRLLARLHMVGAQRPAPNRLKLDPETYVISNFQYLLQHNHVPKDLINPFQRAIDEIVELSRPLFEGVKYQRIHGDCHFGNVLWGSQGVFLVDFDDMVTGPCVQDIWLLLPGRDDYTKEQREILLDAYEELREFDRRSMRLIEVLRTFRYIHFSAWIARRWEDPAFKPVFRTFGTLEYWREQLTDLYQQLDYIRPLVHGEEE
jgi:Ser/Thr protein kinase RdoA (MazF antagonist)